jgi:hypothetical protein
MDAGDLVGEARGEAGYVSMSFALVINGGQESLIETFELRSHLFIRCPSYILESEADPIGKLRNHPYLMNPVLPSSSKLLRSYTNLPNQISLKPFLSYSARTLRWWLRILTCLSR